MSANSKDLSRRKTLFALAGIVIVVASFFENTLILVAYRHFVDPLACMDCSGVGYHDYPNWVIIPMIATVIVSFWAAWRFAWKPHGLTSK